MSDDREGDELVEKLKRLAEKKEAEPPPGAAETRHRRGRIVLKDFETRSEEIAALITRHHIANSPYASAAR